MKKLLLAMVACTTFAACDQRDRPYNSTTQSTRNTVQNREDVPRDQNGLGDEMRKDFDNAMRKMRERATSGNETDRALSAKVRQALGNDNTLSVNPNNITVEASNGAVTLRGFVANDAEKNAVEKKVQDVDGVSSVDNKLEVRPAVY